MIHTINKQTRKKYSNLSKDFVLQNIKTLSMHDVIAYNQYDEDFLIQLVPYFNMKKLLITQKLSLNFIFKYILNKEYHFDDDETLLDIDDIVRYQNYSLKEIEEYQKTNN